jgi:hypothetical protein
VAGKEFAIGKPLRESSYAQGLEQAMRLHQLAQEKKKREHGKENVKIAVTALIVIAIPTLLMNAASISLAAAFYAFFSGMLFQLFFPFERLIKNGRGSV